MIAILDWLNLLKEITNEGHCHFSLILLFKRRKCRLWRPTIIVVHTTNCEPSWFLLVTIGHFTKICAKELVTKHQKSVKNLFFRQAWMMIKCQKTDKNLQKDQGHIVHWCPFFADAVVACRHTWMWFVNTYIKTSKRI